MMTSHLCDVIRPTESRMLPEPRGFGSPGDIPDPRLCSTTTSRSQAPFFRSHSLTVPSSELDRTRPLQNCRHVTADWCLLGPEGNITRVFETTGGVTTFCDVTTLPHLAACADTVRSGCPTLGLSSRRSRTRGRRHAAPCRWLAIGGPSVYGHTHLDRTHPNSANKHDWSSLHFGYDVSWFTCFYVPNSDGRVQRAADHEHTIELGDKKYGASVQVCA